jgi:maleylacetate reductase
MDTAPPIFRTPASLWATQPVVHSGKFTRVIFGMGTATLLRNELEGTGAHRALVIGTPGRRAELQWIADSIAPRAIGICSQAVMHTPVAVSDRVTAESKEADADLLISLGGGSAIGLGKAVSLRSGLPHIALPTTYSGSEFTPILGQTESGIKRTMRDDKLRPVAIIYDPNLSLGVSAHMAVASGMNAMAHAVEALYMTNDADVADVASAAIQHLCAALPLIGASPRDGLERGRALYGAWLAGFCLAETPMALHHKLCHTLGGAFDLPHAQAHAVLLPHSLAYNAPAIAPAYARLKLLLGDLARDPAEALYCLVEKLGLPKSLEALGLPEEGIDRVARLACQDTYANPRPLEHAAISRLLLRARAGALPTSEAVLHA